MPDLLFVYGTLRVEFNNAYARQLRAGAVFAGRTTIRGSIFDLGRYPGYRPLPDGEVVGELWRIQEPPGLLDVLDKWEGEEYRRVRVGGVWIYQLVDEPPPNSRIESGDYLAR